VNFNILTTDDVRSIEATRSIQGGTPTTDDFWARLRKYVPAETIGGYLVLIGLVRQVFDDADQLDEQRIGIIVTAAIMAGLTWVATRTMLKVKRTSQRLISLLAFTVWIVGDGSLLGTFDWWQPAIGLIAVVLFGVLVAVFKLRSLPQN
jgi:hypothetical protein